MFWGSFAASRGLAILLAMIARPGLIMWANYCLCLLGCGLMASMADWSITALYTGTALMGLGMASIFATGFLWVEERMIVTSRMSATFSISNSLGAKVFPVLIGQFVETWPMMLHYTSLATVTACALIFILAHLVPKRMNQNNQHVKYKLLS